MDDRRPSEIREAVRGGDSVALADDVDKARRQVGDGRDPEPVGEAVEERQVDGLGDRTEAEDADADAVWHGGRCSGRCHRAKYMWAMSIATGREGRAPWQRSRRAMA